MNNALDGNGLTAEGTQRLFPCGGGVLYVVVDALAAVHVAAREHLLGGKEEGDDGG
jgi:hypothetical protein